MFTMLLLWSSLLALLFMLTVAPVPDTLRAYGLVALVATTWLLWALYGVEYLADRKWPQRKAVPESSILKPAAVASSSPSNPDQSEGPTARLGQVGDLFGGISALFAALAFAGVGIAAYQQAKSTRLAFKQAIEATVFSAIELHHKIAESLRFDRFQLFPAETTYFEGIADSAGTPRRPKPPPVDGRSVFGDVLRGISFYEGKGTRYEALIANYRFLQTEHNYVLGHYFRNLYQVLKLIDEDEALDNKGKQKYASLLRAQLSTDELALLMVNCAGDMVDDGQFRALIVRYRMLEHLPLKMSGSDYVYAGQKNGGVLADESSIKQYLSNGEVRRTSRSYAGAFGANPTFRGH